VIVLPLVLALGACVAPDSSVPRLDAAAIPAMTTRVDTAAALYASGVTYAQFLEEATNRKAQWTKHSEQAAVADVVLARARAVPGKWKLLVVLEDGCSDSVNTIPYIAKLVEQVPSMEMRLVRSSPGKPVMEAHRTPDGRAATPTVLVLDEAMTDRGCFVERPVKLRSYLEENKDKSEFNFGRDKQAWYDADAGAETVREVVEVMEAAAGGGRVCR
jgi:hypothetical protein